MLKRLRAEIIAIEREVSGVGITSASPATAGFRGERARSYCRTSAAACKAVSNRMKRDWAERRKAQAKVK